MTAQEIKTAIGQIKTLPVEDRIEIANQACHELQTEAFGDELRVAFANGELDQIIKETDEEYERGEALDRFC